VTLSGWLRSVLVARYTLWSTVWLGMAVCAAVVAEAIPCVDWVGGPSGAAAAFYQQPRYAPGGLLFYAVQLALGFGYTTRVVLYWNNQEWRKLSPMMAVMVVGLALYPLGPILVLNGPCTPHEQSSLPARLAVSLPARVVAYSMPQFAAQFFSLLDFIDGAPDLALRAESIAKWGVCQWASIVGILGGGLAIAAYDMYLLYSIDRLQWYVLALVAVIVSFAALAYCLRASHAVHIHHYCLGLLAPFFPVASTHFCTVMQAALLGIGIEGFSRWGPDPLLVRRPPSTCTSSPPASSSGATAVLLVVPNPAYAAPTLPTPPVPDYR